MRLTPLLLTALHSFARAAALASSFGLLVDCAQMNGAPSSEPAASLPEAGCLDVQGQRELLAGIELEMGQKSAALARCSIERTHALTYGQQQAARADAAESRTVWVSALTSVVGAALAAAITAGIEAAVNAHKQPAMAGSR